MKQMHKHDPKLPNNAQDRRFVVSIEPENRQVWLSGNPEQALALIQPPTATNGGDRPWACKPRRHGTTDNLKRPCLRSRRNLQGL
jgi:hypothetical protein